MPHVDAGPYRLHYRRRGQGEPLLLIQGMSGHHLMWGEPFLTRLEDDFDIVAYDHRGIGHSARVDEPFTIADLAGDAAALMDAVGWSNAHVLGISMGGMVAQELVLRHQDRVRTLILGCTYAGGDGASLIAPGPQRMIEAMRTGNAELSVRTGFEVNVSRRFAGEAGNFEPFQTTALGAPAPVPVIMLQAQAALEHDTSARLPQITVPTLVIHGTEDEMVLAHNSELIAKLIPGARLELWEGVGHLFWWEQPERTAALVREHALGRG
ncbi:MAG: alpha/beta fold hydrolase [Dehalococcoidia bacterium]